MLNFLYIDPTATSILISSLTAVFVAIGAVGIILWRKFKKGAAKVLHIDENAHKEVEEDIVLNDELEDAPVEAAESEEPEESEEDVQAEPAADEPAKKAVEPLEQVEEVKTEE